MSITEIIQICTLVLTAIGLILAGVGLKTWNFQLRGSYKFELAKSTRITIARMGKRVSKLFDLLNSPYYDGPINKVDNEYIQSKLIDLVFKNPKNLTELGDLDEFSKQIGSLEEKVFECEFAFKSESISPILKYYNAINLFESDILLFRTFAAKGISDKETVDFVKERFSLQNLQLIENKHNAAIDYLDRIMNDPLAPQFKWSLPKRDHSAGKRLLKKKI